MRNHYLQQLLLLGSVLCPAISVMRADTISSFNFNGTFTNGVTGTGLVNINVTTGMVTTINIGVTGITGSTYSFNGPQQQGVSGSSYRAVAFDLRDDAIILNFPQNSLVGYTGGQLCSTSLACSGNVPSLYGSGTDGNVNASFAALTTPNIPVSVPEIDPTLWYGSVVMLAGAIAVIRGQKRSSVV